MAGGNPESPSQKRRSFASFFSVTGERGPLSPQNNQSTPRNSTLQVFDTDELGGFTPNSAVPMQASISNTSSNHPSSSDFSMSPNNYFETSMSSPNSSHGFSSGTTPGYDQDMPFDMSTPMPEDVNLDDFIHEPPTRTNTQPTTQTSLAIAATANDNVFPSPAMTNASLNAQTRPTVLESLSAPSLPTLSGPNITVDDHDATQSSRRTKKRSGSDEAVLNRVLPIGKAVAATDDEIPSLRDQELIAKESENHMKVFRWLSGEGSGHLDASKTGRIRSRSVGQMDPSSKPADAAQTAAGQAFKLEESLEFTPVDGTPRGEGDVLFDDSEEESSNGHTSDEEGLPDSLIPENELGFPDGIVSHVDDDDIGPPRHIDSIQRMTEEEEMALVNSGDPHPNAFYRPSPWYDPPKPISTLNIREGITHAQPNSSNAAIERWKRANENIETASRVATFGTMRSRRYSIGEMDGLFKRMSFGPNEENLSVVQRPNAHQDRKPSLFEVKNVLKRFSSAGHEHKNAALHALQNLSDKNSKDHKPLRKDSQKSKLGRERSPSRLSSLTRKLSKKRKQSEVDPSKDTTSAFASMAGLSMSIGGGEAASSSNPMSPQIKRLGSLSKGRIEFGIPAFTSPTSTGRHQSQGSLSVPPFEPLEHEASDGETDAPSEPVPALPPQLKIPIDKITPNRAGFAKHCLQLNSQLQPKLVDRIAIEQVKRFRKLQENFLKHHATVQTSGKCNNDHQCGAVANQGRDNNAHVGLLETSNNASYSMQEYDSDDEDVPSTDGRVTATQFPPGVPMPPVNRLPAEFECTLCFKVKKFTKPSDWTKHVHEDVQPFTCTFPDCTEPKSFKRKADWVRHENEKHRHLEWWTCNLPDCNHKCYRKDNFVQHLVREHKMPEVKVKAAKSTSSKSAAAGARGTKKGKGGMEDDEANRLWDIVAACYKETGNKPTSEPCRFCGCRLQSWKKLTVHLARHMEAISLPVITLIGEDAVLSPASTRRGNSTTVTPITPFNPSAFSSAEQGNITPILPDLRSMYVGTAPQASFYSPTRPAGSGVYPSPGVTPQRNGNVVESRIYTNAMDPSLTATLHHQTQFQIHNDLELFMQEHQQQQHPHAPQNPMSYNIPGTYGMSGHDGMLGYSNPNMVGHVAPGLGITNPATYGGWNQTGQQPGEDETERYMNWPSTNHHPQPW